MSRKTRRNKRRKQKSLMSPDVAVTIAVAAPEKREQKAEGGKTQESKFPDLTGDGKVTRPIVTGKHQETLKTFAFYAYYV